MSMIHNSQQARREMELRAGHAQLQYDEWCGKWLEIEKAVVEIRTKEIDEAPGACCLPAYVKANASEALKGMVNASAAACVLVEERRQRALEALPLGSSASSGPSVPAKAVITRWSSSHKAFDQLTKLRPNITTMLKKLNK